MRKPGVGKEDSAQGDLEEDSYTAQEGGDSERKNEEAGRGEVSGQGVLEDDSYTTVTDPVVNRCYFLDRVLDSRAHAGLHSL